MSILLTAIIATDGAITVTADDPADFEAARDTIMSMMAAIAGDNPIAYTDCLDPQETNAMSERLAKVLLTEVT